ncbi:MAG: hypothetical protein GY820_05620 [Gammaproteobacteria bacterium]|nr:hypothetical protein [Gammaproteobacteria bacterium]
MTDHSSNGTVPTAEFKSAKLAPLDHEGVRRVRKFQILLHEKTRSAWRLDLKNSVVVVDEAHNLAQAIGAMHSCELSISQVIGARQQLRNYAERFKNRLKAKNLMYVRLLLNSLNLIGQFLEQWTKNDGVGDTVFTLVEFQTKVSALCKMYLFVCRCRTHMDGFCN